MKAIIRNGGAIFFACRILTHWLCAAPLEEASVTRVINDVWLRDSAQQVRSAQQNDRFTENMLLQTGDKSMAELFFTDKTLARVGSNSYFTFKRGTRDMNLQKGTLLLQVPKKAGGAKITTAAVTAAVTGTTIMMETDPGGAEQNEQPPSAPPATEMGARVVAVTGQAGVVYPGQSKPALIQQGDTVPPQAAVITGKGGSVLLQPVYGVSVKIDEETRTRLAKLQDNGAGTPPDIEFDLEYGGIYSAIKRPQNLLPADFRVRTPVGVSAARGTVLGVILKGNRLWIFGAHGSVTFFDPAGRQLSVSPGQCRSFIGVQGGAQAGEMLKPGNWDFDQALDKTLDLLKQGADQGIISPGFLNDVGKALQEGGVKLTPGQQNRLTPPSQPPEPSQGISSKKDGYSKIVVLEGTLRVFLNTRVGESMLLKPGQMLICPPNARILPKAVDVDIGRIVRTAPLVNPDTALGEDLQTNLINKAIDRQFSDKVGGRLMETVFVMQGQMLEIDKKVLADSHGSLTNKLRQQPLKTIEQPVPFPIDSSTRITRIDSDRQPTPQITTGNAIGEGTIIHPEIVHNTAQFVFGDVIPFDHALDGPTGPLPDPTSAFKFKELSIAGDPWSNPLVATPGLMLISEGPLNVASSDTLFFRDFDSLYLISQFDDINVLGTTFAPTLEDLNLYSRTGDIDILGTSVLSVSGQVSAAASDSLSLSATADIVAPSIRLFGANSIALAGGLHASNIDIVTGGTLNLNPGIFDMPDGGSLHLTGGTMNLSGLWDFRDFNPISGTQRVHADIVAATSFLAQNDLINVDHLRITGPGAGAEFRGDNISIRNLYAPDASLLFSTGAPQAVIGSYKEPSPLIGPDPSVSNYWEFRQINPSSSNIHVNFKGSNGIQGGDGNNLAMRVHGPITFGNGGGQIRMDPNTEGFIGGDSMGPLNSGGDGGRLDVQADGPITVDTGIFATTGQHGAGLNVGGRGGDVHLESQDAVVVTGAGAINVSSNAGGRESEYGGNVHIESHRASGVAIEVQNSSQLSALLDSLPETVGKGGVIRLEATGANASIEISNSGAAESLVADEGTIEVMHHGMNGQILIQGPGGSPPNPTMRAETIKLEAIGANGQLRISNQAWLQADTRMNLFGGYASNGILFDGGGTIRLDSPDILMKGYSIEVSGGTTVQAGTGVASDVLTIRADSQRFSGGGYGDININTRTVTPNTGATQIITDVQGTSNVGRQNAP